MFMWSFGPLCFWDKRQNHVHFGGSGRSQILYVPRGGACKAFGAALLSPEGPKVPNYRAFMVSILGIVTMVLGRYLALGYLDP